MVVGLHCLKHVRLREMTSIAAVSVIPGLNAQGLIIFAYLLE